MESNLKEVSTLLRTWANEIKKSYSNFVHASFEETLAGRNYKSIVLDVVIRSKVQLEDYGFTLSLAIFMEDDINYRISVDLARGSGLVIKEKDYYVEKEYLEGESKIFDDIFESLREYKSLLFELIEKELKS